MKKNILKIFIIVCILILLYKYQIFLYNIINNTEYNVQYINTNTNTNTNTNIITDIVINNEKNYISEYCDVPCKFQDLDFDKYHMLDLNVNNMSYKIKISMEGEKHYPSLSMKNKPNDNWCYATSNMNSDVPFPYINNIHQIYKPQVPNNVNNYINVIVRNCNSLNNRESIIKELMNHIKVDSLSSCLNNKKWPYTKSNNWPNDKIKVLKDYKFHLAFENQNTDDHITEKVWLALESGTLPIYLGTSNIKKYVPTNSIIDINDFKNISKLITHLKELINDEEKYNKYHMWRYKPVEKRLLDIFLPYSIDVRCRICRWMYAKKNNLKWCKKDQHFLIKNTDC